MPSSAPPPSSSPSTANIINHLSQRSSSSNYSSSLTNKYYALRHGQSLANIAKIISSDPAISTKQHGLSELGKEQVRIAGEAFATDYMESISNNNGDDTNQGVAIFSSDFLRATETATIFASILRKHDIPIYQNNIILETRLRERYFGELNGGPDTRYQEVWNEDVKDANHVKFGVESANSVLERTTRFIVELEDRLSMTSSSSESNEQGGTETDQEGRCNRRPWMVILVAHGDVLQISQTGFLLHEDASRHRSLDHLETATVRELTLHHESVGVKWHAATTS